MKFVEITHTEADNILRSIIKDEDTSTLEALKEACLTLHVIEKYMGETKDKKFFAYLKSLPKDMQNNIARAFIRAIRLSNLISGKYQQQKREDKEDQI